MNVLLLAQDEPPLPPHLGGFAPWGWEISSWLYAGFVLWMVISCIRQDPEARMWVWIIIALPPLGPFIYLLARYLPTREWRGPKWLRRFTRGSEIRRKEIAAHNIGNAHQFIELGDVLREVSRWEQAREAYAKALAKDPESVAALWGAGQCEYQCQSYEAARGHLAKILQKDPAYKFGDVSLLQGKVLLALGDDEAAIAHFREHTRRWRHPEALYLLATLLAKQGNAPEARQLLEGLLMDLEAAPRAIARKQLFWRSRAKRLRRSLPR